jgi:ubiquinone/menaquinone biosynthesis C-methylase UbiE
MLEVGCGEGIALHYMKPAKYVGVDTSLAWLHVASTKNKNYTFVQGDGTCLPFFSEKFDLVFCKGILHHLSKQEVFLVIKEIVRTCKMGGRVAIIEPNVYNLSSFLFGLLRKPERGILHCKPKVFLEYFKRLGMSNELTLTYDGTFAPMQLFAHLFNKRNFVKASWFIRLWEIIDYIMNKIIPEKFWTSMTITARKGPLKQS